MASGNSQVSVQVAVRLRPVAPQVAAGRAVQCRGNSIKVTTAAPASAGAGAASSPISSTLQLFSEDGKNGSQSSLDAILAASMGSSTGLSSSEPRSHAFQYDTVFGPDAQQEEVYDNTVAPLVLEFLRGFHCTVFAYGQTGSGKTYTMGSGSVPEQAEDQGIVPRALTRIFGQLAGDNAEFRAAVSMVEVYNEEIYDLLRPQPAGHGGLDIGTVRGLSLREDATGAVYVQGAQERPVRTSDECLEWLQQGLSARSTGSTQMNAVSSRSHAILTLSLYQRRRSGAGVLHSKFHFVDLAGSERLKRSKAAGDRKREGIAINQGLLVLGQVISALAERHTDSASGAPLPGGPHVPYRDSKLTRLLQSSLGGNARTLMLACVSPADADAHESLCTLRYAARARAIKNACCVNLMRPPGSPAPSAATELCVREKDAAVARADELERKAADLDAENARLRDLLAVALEGRQQLANQVTQQWLAKSKDEFYQRHRALCDRVGRMKGIIQDMEATTSRPLSAGHKVMAWA